MHHTMHHTVHHTVHHTMQQARSTLQPSELTDWDKALQWQSIDIYGDPPHAHKLRSRRTKHTRVEQAPHRLVVLKVVHQANDFITELGHGNNNGARQKKHQQKCHAQDIQHQDAGLVCR